MAAHVLDFFPASLHTDLIFDPDHSQSGIKDSLPSARGGEVTEREFRIDPSLMAGVIFPSGNTTESFEFMRLTPQKIGEIVRTARQKIGVTQRTLALTSGTGLRFIIELERGKPTCQLGKVLAVMNTLGVNISLKLPATSQHDEGHGPGE